MQGLLIILTANWFPDTNSSWNKDIYVNCFYLCTARLWNSFPVACIPLNYDLNGFNLRVNMYITFLFLYFYLITNFLIGFPSFSSSFSGNYILCSVCSDLHRSNHNIQNNKKENSPRGLKKSAYPWLLVPSLCNWASP